MEGKKKITVLSLAKHDPFKRIAPWFESDREKLTGC